MDLPLASLRVLDLTEGDAQYCGRYLADLGAHVTLVEPPGGSAGRRDPSGFGLRNANKASVLLNLDGEAGSAELLRLAGTADILLESFGPSQAERHRLTPDALRQAHPGLVVVSVTGFGRSGPYRDFAATEPVLAALNLGEASGSGPLAGLRVLDLGVIVFGAELGRLLADQGADVIKVENSAFPDGLRQTLTGGAMNASFAWAQRNKRGLGLDLRSEPGRRLFLDLVRQADVVLANFKPGTLASLGLSYAELSQVNPRIIVSDSSAFGSAGAWSGRLGYGPLVRASCGVSELWRDPDGAFCDGVTVYPDHVAAHVAAIAVLAAVIGRARSGRGAALEVTQADVAVMHLGLVLAALGAGQAGSPGDTAWVLPCAGDDEWCVIDVRDDEDRTRLAALLGGADLARWTSERRPDDVMAAVQAAGVPAGSMRRLPELLTDPHLAARQSFRTMSHPLLSRPVPANARAARFSTISDPPLRPAPVPGQHTRQIGQTLLGLSPSDIDRLVGEGVLQEGTV